MLPSNVAGLVLWVQANSGRFTTAAGSTPANTNGDPIGRWEDNTADDRHLVQTIDASRPTFLSSTPGVRFDGVNDYLKYTGSRADLVGSLILAFVTGATSFATRGAQVLFAVADEGSANNWFEVGITGDGRIYVESNNGGTKHTVVASRFLSQSTAYHLALTFDGTDYYIQVSGAEQNPLTILNVGTFAWLGDVVGADNITLGGTVTSAGLVRPFQGDILEVALYSEDIT